MPKTKDFAKLRKQGNSLVITIPRGLVQTLNWEEDDELFLEVKYIGPSDSFLKQQTEPRVLQVSKTRWVEGTSDEKSMPRQ